MDPGRQASKLYKEATSLSNPSLLSFRFAAEWERATPLYEKAAQLFRQAGDYGMAKQCLEKAAMGQERQRSGWHAAKNMEKAGEIAKEMGIWDDVEECYSRAAEYYNGEGRHTAAADALAKGARALEEKRPEVAAKMYQQAVEWMEESGKDALAGDVFRQAISHLIKTQKWGDAVRLLMRFAASCDACGARSSQCKAYLGAVVVWLYGQDAKQAWMTYQDALEVETFASSDEAFAAEALFDAYRTGDPEAVVKLVKKNQTLSNLDNQIARLCKKLPTGDVAKLGHQLGGAAPGLDVGEGGEEDLT